MAVVNTKSNGITNADATPMVRSARALVGAPLLSMVATLAVAAGDDDTSVYRFCRLPSNAVIMKIDLLNDAITDGTVYDVGLYQTAANGGAVASVNCFANDVDLSSARVAPLDVLHQALDINKAEKRLWEVLALPVDSGCEYDLCLTGATVGTAAGDITLKVYYTV